MYVADPTSKPKGGGRWYPPPLSWAFCGSPKTGGGLVGASFRRRSRCWASTCCLRASISRWRQGPKGKGGVGRERGGGLRKEGIDGGEGGGVAVRGVVSPHPNQGCGEGGRGKAEEGRSVRHIEGGKGKRKKGGADNGVGGSGVSRLPQCE